MRTLHLPVPPGLRGFELAFLSRDAMAGLAIAAVAIPSAIAYPAIAGLPPEVGLYSSIVPLVGYALLGPSRFLVVGPDAATMTVLAAVLATMPLGGVEERVMAASALAIGVGLFCLAAGLLRLGVVATFLSRPILVGFISGIAISILIGQIGRFTGLKIDAEGLVGPFVELWRHAGSIHLPSLLLGLGALALLQILSALRSPIPGPLVVVALCIAGAAVLDFEGLGIKVVGALPPAFPTPALPNVAGLPIKELLIGTVAIWLVSFSSGIVAARSFAERGGFTVDVDAELTGLGAANLASGLFRGFPVTVSDSRTAINLSVGGRSQASGLVAAAALTVGMLYLGDALSRLPAPALGAILASAALGLVDVAGLREIWRISRMEFLFALIGLWGAISLGVLNGVVVAVGATLLYMLLKMTRPHVVRLGRIPGRLGFYKLHRNKEARAVEGLAVVLVQGSLLFFNVDWVKAQILEAASEAGPSLDWLVIDASAMVQIDSTAAAMLEGLNADLAKRGVALGFAELHHDPGDILDRAGLIARLSPGMVFDDIEDVPAAFGRRGVSAETEGGVTGRDGPQ